MFDNCTTLAELNASRIQAVQAGGNIVDINNAFNARRKDIINKESNNGSYTKLKVIKVTPDETVNYCGVPVAGRSSKIGVIQFTPQGFYY